MNEQNQTPATPEPEETAYTPPEVVEIGTAGKMINGEGGKHSDSYTGYHWNGEG